jgi:signal transduction histidine kinase
MYNDFARLQRDFARQNARLRRVGTEKDLILDMAAHDLRNPLNAICLLASSVASAAKSRLTDGELASLEKIDKTARDMGDLLNNLLAHRRDESGMNAIERVDTDIVSLARRRIDLAMPLAAEKAVAIVVDTTRSHVMFPVDPARLQQVFDNLLGNAIRYSPQNGDIVFSIDTTGDELRISISDRGPGIPDERLSRVFEPFYRGEPSTAKEASGMGLGLAICRNIVLAHGGQIWAKNRTGGGTKLNLRIPRHSPTHRRDDHGAEDLALEPDGPSGSTMDPAVPGRPILLRASESSAPSRSPHALRTRS